MDFRLQTLTPHEAASLDADALILLWPDAWDRADAARADVLTVWGRQALADGDVGAEPHRAWMIGDNLYADIGGAKASGLTATWIHRGRLKLPETPPALPDRSIGHLAPELWEALELVSPSCQTGL